jgi:aryl-phospho-beta-D-glucosidase BglC (GH1 family)
MKKLEGFQRGMGIGGWLTNYKRFNVLPADRRMQITVGDMEHFESYITEADVAYIASLGMDHIRLGFDQIVLEEIPTYIVKRS